MKQMTFLLVAGLCIGFMLSTELSWPPVLIAVFAAYLGGLSSETQL